MTAAIPDPRAIVKASGDYDYVALLLLGGGALGSCQGGAYEALAEAGSSLIGWPAFPSAPSMVR